MVGTEYREAQPRDNQSGNTAGVVFLPKPVVGEDSSKHGGQHEVQSFSCGMFGLCLVYQFVGLCLVYFAGFCSKIVASLSFFINFASTNQILTKYDKNYST